MAIYLMKSQPKIPEIHRIYNMNHTIIQPLIIRVGQNHIYSPYMTVYLVISLSEVPYIHRILWLWPTLVTSGCLVVCVCGFAKACGGVCALCVIFILYFKSCDAT